MKFFSRDALTAALDWGASSLYRFMAVNIVLIWIVLSALRAWPTVFEIVGVAWGIGTIGMAFYLTWRAWLKDFEKKHGEHDG